jgi:hypothetical protein
MDNKYNNVLQKLNNHNTTHPQIILLWKNYLKNKMNNLQISLDKCTQFIENVGEHGDIDYTTLLILLHFFPIN